MVLHKALRMEKAEMAKNGLLVSADSHSPVWQSSRRESAATVWFRKRKKLCPKCDRMFGKETVGSEESASRRGWGATWLAV